MAINLINNGQEDWLNVLNADLTELDNRDSGTWTSAGLTAINGYTLNGCSYFYGMIGGRKYLMIRGNLSINSGSGSINGQTDREVLQLPSTVKGCGIKVTGYTYAENSNNGYPLLINYNSSNQRLDFVNITDTTTTFTSIDFGIIMTE